MGSSPIKPNHTKSFGKPSHWLRWRLAVGPTIALSGTGVSEILERTAVIVDPEQCMILALLIKRRFKAMEPIYSLVACRNVELTA